MFKDVNIKQILRVMLVVLFAAFMLTACDSPKEGKTSLNADKRAALSVKDDSGQQELANQHRECWQTGIIDLLYENMGKVAMGMYAKITDGALPLMMIAFALWTIFRLLKFVGSFTEDSPAEIWNEIVRKLFVCLICGLIASSTTQILWLLNTVVFPIYYAFLELWRGNFEQYRRRKQLQGQQRCCHQVLSGTDNAEPAGNVYGTGSWPSINRKPVFSRWTEIHDELYDLCR